MSTTCTYSSRSCLWIWGGELRGEVEVPPPSGEIGSGVGDGRKQGEVVSDLVFCFPLFFVS